MVHPRTIGRVIIESLGQFFLFLAAIATGWAVAPNIETYVRILLTTFAFELLFIGITLRIYGDRISIEYLGNKE